MAARTRQSSRGRVMTTLRPCAAAGTLAKIVLITALCTTVQAAHPFSKIQIDRAEFALSSEERPPGESAAWTPITLPDEWRRTNPRFSRQGWYRMNVTFVQPPSGIHAVLIKYRRSHRIDYFVNGNLVGGSLDVTTTYRRGTLLRTPVYITVPPSMLRSGQNVLHVRMQGTSAETAMHGLGPVTFGRARDVRKDYIDVVEQESAALSAIFGVAFAAGLIAMCLWLARRSDRVMLLLALTCLAWAFAAAWHQPLRSLELPLPIYRMLEVFMSYGLPSLAVMLCLRTLDLRWPRFEAALWAYLVVQTALPLWGLSSHESRLVWEGANTALLLIGLTVVVAFAQRPLRWVVYLQIATLFLMALLMFSEFMRFFGWIDIESPIVRHYHAPLMIVGIGIAIFAEHVLAVWRAENMNVELERRVADKTREIEANHARVEEATRELALAGERQRIVTDMHDGLGASLVGLLRYVQTTHKDFHVEQCVKEALQELRIAIDALEPSARDLASVLGNLRYRLAPLLEKTAARLDWKVAELPSISGLEPWGVFALQRIVLEAVANAVRHSHTRHIALAARGATGGGVEICVEDDGASFDAAQWSSGSGTHNMHTRAARIGATLEISSRIGAGTVMRLMIPPVLPSMHDNPEAGRPDLRILHDLLPGASAV
jgi:signal transduction histidine kinase